MRPVAKVDSIISAYSSGQSAREIGSAFGIAKTTVLNCLRRAGVAARTNTEAKAYDRDESAAAFWEKVRKASPDGTKCWIWAGGRGGKNNLYGRTQFLGSMRPAHHVAYELVTGTVVPNDRQLDHLCKTTLCVNPAHLQVVTGRENILRSSSPPGLNAAKTRCSNGHELNEANTYLYKGTRHCRECGRAASRRSNKKENK